MPEDVQSRVRSHLGKLVDQREYSQMTKYIPKELLKEYDADHAILNEELPDSEEE
jgi:hypothetical protein